MTDDGTELIQLRFYVSLDTK